MLAAALVGGCAHVRPAPGGYNVSSERSDYSPTARLAVALPPPGALATYSDSITITIDSGFVSAPGARTADTFPVMRNLYLTALLATAPRSGGRGARPTEPWLAVAESDSVPLVDALRLGERQSVRPVRLRIVAPAAVNPARTWLVFRITGVAVTQEVHLADGRVIPPRSVAGGVRVYACADWALAGSVDRRRARSLARAYTAAC